MFLQLNSCEQNSPLRRFFLNKFSHQSFTFIIVQNDDFYAPLLQVILTTNKRFILSARIVSENKNAHQFDKASAYPITSRLTLYMMHAPVHISQGESVVYIVAPLYAAAGRRPAFSKADISPCRPGMVSECK
jgi:hypothetical protein